MSDEAVVDVEGKTNNKRLLTIVAVVVILGCCCVSFTAVGWFLGDSVMEFFCDQIGVGCL
ncbi:MAG: hypothetical protein OEV06_09930 [Anaerolineae bacterium]|nr:hypothetical protein [Anaerolineae bacterium]